MSNQSDQNVYTVEDLLTPLAITVIIDHKVRDPELSEFVIQAEGLLELLLPDSKMGPPDILGWFRDNEDIMRATLASPQKNTYVLKALSLFKSDDVAVEALYDAMLAISISDKEYHVDESDLIKSAAALWGYVRPPFKTGRLER